MTIEGLLVVYIYVRLAFFVRYDKSPKNYCHIPGVVVVVVVVRRQKR